MKYFNGLVLSNTPIDASILNWKLTSVNTAEKALTYLRSHKFKMLFIQQNVLKTEKEKIKALVSLLHTSIIVIDFKEVHEIERKINQNLIQLIPTKRTIEIADNSL